MILGLGLAGRGGQLSAQPRDQKLLPLAGQLEVLAVNRMVPISEWMAPPLAVHRMAGSGQVYTAMDLLVGGGPGRCFLALACGPGQGSLLQSFSCPQAGSVRGSRVGAA